MSINLPTGYTNLGNLSPVFSENERMQATAKALGFDTRRVSQILETTPMKVPKTFRLFLKENCKLSYNMLEVSKPIFKRAFEITCENDQGKTFRVFTFSEFCDKSQKL